MRRRGTTTVRGLSARVTARWVAGLAAGGMVAGGLAGCTGGPDEPSWTPTVWTPEESVEPSPTPTPTPTDPAAIPPERPAAMDTVDTAGAEAVAAYYTELFSYVFATGDLDTYRALSHPDCIFCADVIRQVEEQQAAGGHTIGGLTDVQSVRALEVDPGAWWTVDIEMVQRASLDVDAEGAVVKEVPEKTFHLDIAVVFTSGQWAVRAVDHQRTDQ